MLNNEGMGGLEIHDDSPEIDPVSPVVLGSFLKYGLTEISTLTLTLTLTLSRALRSRKASVARGESWAGRSDQ